MSRRSAGWTRRARACCSSPTTPLSRSACSTPASHVPKTYHVQIDRPADEALLAAIRAGVEDRGEWLGVRSASWLREGNRHAWAEIVLDEGRNRHIRRLLARAGRGDAAPGARRDRRPAARRSAEGRGAPFERGGTRPSGAGTVSLSPRRPRRAASRSPRKGSARRGRSGRARSTCAATSTACAAPDRQRQRRGAGALSSGLLAARPLRDRLLDRDAGAVRRSAGSSNTGPTRPRCCRSTSTRPCAGAWPAPTGRGGLCRHARPSPARAGRRPWRCSGGPGRGTSRRLGFREGAHRLVGLVGAQADAGMALLCRAPDDADPAARLRAGLRSARARDPGAGPGAADLRRGTRAPHPGGAFGRALGVATAGELKDYFRLAPPRRGRRSRTSWRPAR